MNQSRYVQNLSKDEMRLVTKMRGINVKKSTSKIELFGVLEKADKIRHKESPFKSIIQDIRNKLSKNGNKDLFYTEEMKKLTGSQVNNIKEKLIKFENELIWKNIIKKDNDIYNVWHYGGITYNAIKDIRYLFNEYEDEDVKDILYFLMNMKMKKLKISDICLMKMKIMMSMKTE